MGWPTIQSGSSCSRGWPWTNRGRGKGLGKALLFDALTRIEQAADIVGVRAVMVHAIDETARRFYEHFEFEPTPVDPFQMLLLMKDLRRAIRAG